MHITLTNTHINHWNADNTYWPASNFFCTTLTKAINFIDSVSYVSWSFFVLTPIFKKARLAGYIIFIIKHITKNQSSVFRNTNQRVECVHAYLSTE